MEPDWRRLLSLLNNVEPTAVPLIRPAFACIACIAATGVFSKWNRRVATTACDTQSHPSFIITVFLALCTRPLPMSHFWSCEFLVLMVLTNPHTCYVEKGASFSPLAAGGWTCQPLLLGTFPVPLPDGPAPLRCSVTSKKLKKYISFFCISFVLLVCFHSTHFTLFDRKFCSDFFVKSQILTLHSLNNISTWNLRCSSNISKHNAQAKWNCTTMFVVYRRFIMR